MSPEIINSTSDHEFIKEPTFDKIYGIALDKPAKRFARERAIQALEMMVNLLPDVKAGQHGECLVEIKGVGGSYAFGEPVFGIYPKNVDYDEAHHIEYEKSHLPNGDLLTDKSEPYPSDIDLWMRYRRKDGSAYTLGDALAIDKELKKLFEKVFLETGIFISGNDDSFMKIKSVEEVIQRLKEWERET